MVQHTFPQDRNKGVLFLHPCDAGRSGNDVLKPKFAEALALAGLKSETHPLWPNTLYRAVMNGPLPKRLSLFYLFVGIPCTIFRIPRILRYGGVSINGFGIPRDRLALAERGVKALGKKYIYHYQDNHLAVPFLRNGALSRIHLSDAVIVPTKALRESVAQVAARKPVYVLEEGIDVERFGASPALDQADKPPTVVWCGNPENLKEVPFLVQVLKRLGQRLDFQFRIIAGKRRPDLDCDFDWHPYSVDTEPLLLAGCCAGLAPLADTHYARCKGSYKVKTYLAAGVPPVASPVGHQSDLIQNGSNGFLVNSEQEWEEALTALITDRAMADRMAAKARADAVANYSYPAVAPSWVAAFQKILQTT